RVPLGDQEAETVVRFQRLGDRLHGDGPRHAQRHDHVREDDQIANRQQREHIGDYWIPLQTAVIRRHATYSIMLTKKQSSSSVTFRFGSYFTSLRRARSTSRTSPRSVRIDRR